ncbi:MAG: hypothetical protein KC475_01725 [Cyanobacteria bacterium HKST-UBA03]|nr:hypothetical protein [Cyanobacteria bacterium HKST-UBA03]
MMQPLQAPDRPRFGYRYVFDHDQIPTSLNGNVLGGGVSVLLSHAQLEQGISPTFVGYTGRGDKLVVQSANRQDAKLRQVLTNRGFQVAAADRRPNIDVLA